MRSCLSLLYSFGLNFLLTQNCHQGGSFVSLNVPRRSPPSKCEFPKKWIEPTLTTVPSSISRFKTTRRELVSLLAVSFVSILTLRYPSFSYSVLSRCLIV